MSLSSNVARVRAPLLALALAAGGLVDVAGAQVRYSVTDLSGAFGGFSSASDINELGQVVGGAQMGSSFSPFLWEAGTMSAVPLLGGSEGVALGLNDAGEIVGHTTITGEERAFLYSGGTTSLLPGFAGSLLRGQAHAISPSGYAAGVLQMDPQFGGGGRPVMWNPDQAINIGTFGGSTGIAYDRTDTQIVGSAATATAAGLQRAFSYSANTGLIDLGAPPGTSSTAHGVNARGDAVGDVVFVGGPSLAQSAFVWSQGSMTLLPSLGGARSSALELNDAGHIVGWSETAPGVHHAFLYADGSLTDLNAVIDPGAGWRLWTARSINESGQIVGDGYIDIGGVSTGRAFLLTPLPAGYTGGGTGSWGDVGVGGGAPDSTTPVVIEPMASAMIGGPGSDTTVGSLSLTNASANPADTTTLALQPGITLGVVNGIFVGPRAALTGGDAAQPSLIDLATGEVLVNEGVVTGNLSIRGRIESRAGSEISGTVSIQGGTTPFVGPGGLGTGLAVGRIGGEVLTRVFFDTTGISYSTTEPARVQVPISGPAGGIVGNTLIGVTRPPSCLSCIDVGVGLADGARIAPGNSAGTVTIEGDLAIDDASFLDIELATPGVLGAGVNDLVEVLAVSGLGGDVVLDGILNVGALPGFGLGAYTFLTYEGALTDQGLEIGTAPSRLRLCDRRLDARPDRPARPGGPGTRHRRARDAGLRRALATPDGVARFGTWVIRPGTQPRPLIQSPV